MDMNIECQYVYRINVLILYVHTYTYTCLLSMCIERYRSKRTNKLLLVLYILFKLIYYLPTYIHTYTVLFFSIDSIGCMLLLSFTSPSFQWFAYLIKVHTTLSIHTYIHNTYEAITEFILYIFSKDIHT